MGVVGLAGPGFSCLWLNFFCEKYDPVFEKGDLKGSKKHFLSRFSRFNRCFYLPGYSVIKLELCSIDIAFKAALSEKFSLSATQFITTRQRLN